MDEEEEDKAEGEEEGAPNILIESLIKVNCVFNGKSFPITVD